MGKSTWYHLLLKGLILKAMSNVSGPGTFIMSFTEVTEKDRGHKSNNIFPLNLHKCFGPFLLSIGSYCIDIVTMALISL